MVACPTRCAQAAILLRRCAGDVLSFAGLDPERSEGAGRVFARGGASGRASCRRGRGAATVGFLGARWRPPLRGREIGECCSSGRWSPPQSVQ
jgi:hypothetical protein